MLAESAFRHFGSKTATANALGINRVSVYNWVRKRNGIVPLESARMLEILTKGALKVDESCYPRIADAKRAVRKRA